MKSQMTQSIGIFALLVLFTFSLIPFPSFSEHDGDSLRTAILQVKKLQSAPDTEQLDFSLVFSNTVVALNMAAGLKTLISNQQNDSDSSSTQITICVKIPQFLNHNATALNSPDSGVHLPGTVFLNHYLSHTVSPEIPPPAFS